MSSRAQVVAPLAGVLLGLTALVVSVSVARCSGASSPAPGPESSPPAQTNHVVMIALSAHALRACRALPLVRPVCPRRIPEADPYTAREIVRSPQGKFETFELARGAEYGNPAR